jgi:hypothetical protein
MTRKRIQHRRVIGPRMDRKLSWLIWGIALLATIWPLLYARKRTAPPRTPESRRRSRGRKLATHALALDDAPPGEVTGRGGGDERQQRHADEEKQGDESKSSHGFGVAPVRPDYRWEARSA